MPGKAEHKNLFDTMLKSTSIISERNKNLVIGFLNPLKILPTASDRRARLHGRTGRVNNCVFPSFVSAAEQQPIKMCPLHFFSVSFNSSVWGQSTAGHMKLSKHQKELFFNTTYSLGGCHATQQSWKCTHEHKCND